MPDIKIKHIDELKDMIKSGDIYGLVEEMVTREEGMIKAINYAIQIIESYEADVRNLQSYIDEGNSISGFCQGKIYKEAIDDIKRGFAELIKY